MAIADYGLATLAADRRTIPRSVYGILMLLGGSEGKTGTGHMPRVAYVREIAEMFYFSCRMQIICGDH
ncbi:hypothetical protein [Nocardia asiatica]|uniref:hypothetical protein n=1 Tax=Nocardia asiatica TaxID=209252 RepID=UPI003EDFAAE9